MKAKDIARYLLSLPDEQQEMHMSICTGGYECFTETGPLEVYVIEEQRFDRNVGKMVFFRNVLTFTESEEEPAIKGEIVEERKEIESS